MLVERIDQVKRSPAADRVPQARNEEARSIQEFEHLLKPHRNAIRGLAIGAVLSLGMWIALGTLIWALTK